MLALHRLQARVRGIYVRKNCRSMNFKKFMPNDSYNRFQTVPNSKIVRRVLIF